MHPSLFFHCGFHTEKAHSRCPQVRTNPAARSCQSVKDQTNGTAGSLTDGLSQTQQWTVVPDSDRITYLRRYLLVLHVMTAGGTHRQGDQPVPAATTKNAASPKGCCNRFPQQKTTESVLADSCVNYIQAGLLTCASSALCGLLRFPQ